MHFSRTFVYGMALPSSAIVGCGKKRPCSGNAAFRLCSKRRRPWSMTSSVGVEQSGSGHQVSGARRALHAVLALLIVAGVFAFSFHQLAYHWNWGAVYKYRAKFLQGWMVTVLISLAALVASTAIGLLFALARRSRVLVI